MYKIFNFEALNVGGHFVSGHIDVILPKISVLKGHKFSIFRKDVMSLMTVKMYQFKKQDDYNLM